MARMRAEGSGYGIRGCKPLSLLDLAQDIVTETHLVPQFPHDTSQLHTRDN